MGLDNLSDGTLDNLGNVPEVRLEETDLRSGAAVAEAVRSCRAIFHRDAKRSVPRSLFAPGITTDVNVRGTLNVLHAAGTQPPSSQLRRHPLSMAIKTRSHSMSR